MKTNKLDKLERIAERRRAAEALKNGNIIVDQWKYGKKIDRLAPATPIQLILAERPTYGASQNLSAAAQLQASRASKRRKGGKGGKGKC